MQNTYTSPGSEGMNFTVRKSRLKSVVCFKMVEDIGEVSLRETSSWELTVGGAINRH